MQRREKLRPCSSASKSFPLMLRYRFVVRDPCKVEVMPPDSKAPFGRCLARCVFSRAALWNRFDNPVVAPSRND